jgi:hypothetical protein
MYPHQRWRGPHISHHQGYGFLDAAVSVGTELGPKTIDAKLPPASGKIRRRDLLNVLGGHISIIAATRGAAPRPGANLAARLERENGILLRRDRNSVARSRAKMPAFERR